jgi:hypothetical protein
VITGVACACFETCIYGFETLVRSGWVVWWVGGDGEMGNKVLAMDKAAESFVVVRGEDLYLCTWDKARLLQ